MLGRGRGSMELDGAFGVGHSPQFADFNGSNISHHLSYSTGPDGGSHFTVVD